jgi:YVTN family beta-propeller protein
VGGYPEGIAMHPAGDRVYVANWFTNELSIIDTRTLQVVGTIPTAGDGSRAFGQFISLR